MQKNSVARLEEQIKSKDLEKINQEEEDRQFKNRVKESDDTLKKEMSNHNQLKTRKALIKHEMEQLESELTRTKRQIDKHEDYTMPREKHSSVAKACAVGPRPRTGSPSSKEK